MIITSPVRYTLNFTDKSLTNVVGPGGENYFSGLATSKKPKLYILSDGNKPIYVGVTKQSIRQRLRNGFAAKGAHGYHGYKLKNFLSHATISIWVQEDAGESNDLMDMETIEAEVVFLIRQKLDQWPKGQTEIHFHPSLPAHREIAQRIVGHYLLQNR